MNESSESLVPELFVVITSGMVVPFRWRGRGRGCVRRC